MKCQHCGSETADYRRVCQVCGSPLNVSGFDNGDGRSDAYDNNMDSYQSEKAVPDAGTSYQSQTIKTYGENYNMRQPEQSAGKVYTMRKPVQSEANDYSFNRSEQNTNYSFGQQPVQSEYKPYEPPVQNTNIAYGQPQYTRQDGNAYYGRQYGGYGQQSAPQNNSYSYQGNMTKRDFVKMPSMSKVKFDWMGAWISGYALCALNVVLLLLMNNPYGLIDIVLMLGLTIGIHVGFNRGCAVALLVYAVFNLIAGYIMYHRFMGIWVIVAGVWAVKATFEFHKQWKNYYG